MSWWEKRGYLIYNTTYRRKRMTKTMSDVSCKGRTPSSIGCARRACSSPGDSSANGGGRATGGVAIVWESPRRGESRRYGGGGGRKWHQDTSKCAKKKTPEQDHHCKVPVKMCATW